MPVDLYSKFFITSSCKYEKDANISFVDGSFCPGYSDVSSTSFEGTKQAKLEMMAGVFCSHCENEDVICQQLFCTPARLIVNVTMTILGSFCDQLQTSSPTCHANFCSNDRRKRGVRRSGTTPTSGRLSYECVAAPNWSHIAGIDRWCLSNCHHGNDPVTCPTSICMCTGYQTTTEFTADVTAESLVGDCIQWGPTAVYSVVSGMDTWCKSNCQGGGQCPESHCQCIKTETTPPPTTTTTIPQTTTTLPQTTTTQSQTTTTQSQTTTTQPETTTTQPQTTTTQPQTMSTQPQTTTTQPQTTPTQPQTTTTQPQTTPTQPQPTTTQPQTKPTQPQTTTTQSQTMPTQPQTTTTQPQTTTTQPQTTTTQPQTTTTQQQTTTTRDVGNGNATDTDSARVVRGIVCDQGRVNNHNTITSRYCEGSERTGIKGFEQELIDQVLSFSTKILCAMTTSSGQYQDCPSMFCGGNPLSQEVIRSSVCSVCETFKDSLTDGCSQAYCS